MFAAFAERCNFAGGAAQAETCRRPPLINSPLEFPEFSKHCIPWAAPPPQPGALLSPFGASCRTAFDATSVSAHYH